jgi:CRISPR-associated endonuclease Cas2
LKRFVVCYDVSDNSKRLKVMKRLKGKGFHAQLSFFEVEANSGGAVATGIRDLLETTDRFAVVRVSKKGKVKRIGSLFEGMGWVL